MKKIEACWITLNRSCNLRCSFCYTNTLGFKASDCMSFGDFEKVVDFCLASGIGHVTLIGGEPTVYEKLPECIKLLNEKGLTFTIVTNGIRLTNEAYLNSLLENGLSKCSMVSISVKETNETFYEKVTGARAFETTLKAFKKMKELHIPSSFSFVITPENVDRYLDGLGEFIKCSGNYYVGLSICYDFNQTSSKTPGYLNDHDYFDLIKRFIKTIPELNRITDGKWNLQNGIPRCLIDDEDYEVIREHSTIGCQLIDGWGVVFNTDLSIIPCNSTYDLKLCKLGKDFNTYEEFKDLYENGVPAKAMRHLRSLPHLSCKACSSLKWCKGGCLAYWSQFDFKGAMDFKYKHNFGGPFKNPVKPLFQDGLIGVHGTSNVNLNAILSSGRIQSNYDKHLDGDYNFAFLLKPSYKDYSNPFGLSYLVSVYDKAEVTNIYPFDSGYYLGGYHPSGNGSKPMLANYWIPYDEVSDFVIKHFGDPHKYYDSAYSFIPTNNVEKVLLDLYKKGKRGSNPDYRVRSIELSCQKDHLIGSGNLIALLTPISLPNPASNQNATWLPYSSAGLDGKDAEDVLKGYYLMKGILQ